MQDNQFTIRLLTNKGASAGRTKHLRRRFHGLRERISTGDISVQYLPTVLAMAVFISIYFETVRAELAKGTHLRMTCH